MNQKQYNNLIENTLKHEQTDDSLSTARSIFDNMGIALPQGDMKTVYETIKTDAYMGWKPCTSQEAQAAADLGIAAIGISKDKIVVLSAKDEEQPVAQTAHVMILDEKTSEDYVSDLIFYQYANMRSYNHQYGATWDSLEDAMNHYGRDFTYTYCGGYYNYYYTFSDGSRMYFRVIET